MMYNSVTELHRTVDGIMGAVGPSAEEVHGKEEYQVMEMVDVVKQAVSPELRPHEARVIRKMQEAIYPVCSFHYANSKEFVDEHVITHEEFWFNFVVLLLRNQLYNVRRSQENVISHCRVLALEDVVDVGPLGKRAIRSVAHAHLFRSALQPSLWYKMLFKTSKEEDHSSDGRQGI